MTARFAAGLALIAHGIASVGTRSAGTRSRRRLQCVAYVRQICVCEAMHAETETMPRACDRNMEQTAYWEQRLATGCP